MGHRKHKGRGSNNKKKVHNDENAGVNETGNGNGGGSARRSRKKAAAAILTGGGGKRGGSRQKKGRGRGTNGGIVRFGSSSSAAADDYAFRNSLESGGARVIHEMAADGNCLFRSLSDQLFGDYGERCDAVRADICDFLEANEGEFKGFLILDDVDSGAEEDAKSFGEYVARMREEGEWGGNPELVAAARLYRRNITVFSAIGAFSIECGGDEPPSGADLLISYHENDHYNSVWREDGSGQTEKLITVVPQQRRRQQQQQQPTCGTSSSPASPGAPAQVAENADQGLREEVGGAEEPPVNGADGDGDTLPPSTSPVSSTSTPDREPPLVNGLCKGGGKGGGGGGGRLLEQKRNESCACGSGLKYKKCCLARRKREARLAKWREKHELPPPAAAVEDGGGGGGLDGCGAAEMLEGDFRVLRI